MGPIFLLTDFSSFGRCITVFRRALRNVIIWKWGWGVNCEKCSHDLRSQVSQGVSRLGITLTRNRKGFLLSIGFGGQ